MCSDRSWKFKIKMFFFMCPFDPDPSWTEEQLYVILTKRYQQGIYVTQKWPGIILPWRGWTGATAFYFRLEKLPGQNEFRTAMYNRADTIPQNTSVESIIFQFSGSEPDGVIFFTQSVTWENDGLLKHTSERCLKNMHLCKTKLKQLVLLYWWSFKFDIKQDVFSPRSDRSNETAESS